MEDRTYTRDELEQKIGESIDVTSYGINKLVIAMLDAKVDLAEMRAQFQAGLDDAREGISPEIAESLDKVTEFLVNG